MRFWAKSRRSRRKSKTNAAATCTSTADFIAAYAGNGGEKPPESGTYDRRKRLDELQSESEKSAALDKALTHISACAKTEKDVRKFLQSKGYLPTVENYVIEKMRSYGFINDAAYAKTYALSAGKRKGRRLIKYELLGKGIAEADISAAFAEIDEARAEEPASEEDTICETRAAEEIGGEIYAGKSGGSEDDCRIVPAADFARVRKRNGESDCG